MLDNVREMFYEYGIEVSACIVCATVGYFVGKKKGDNK